MKYFLHEIFLQNVYGYVFKKFTLILTGGPRSGHSGLNYFLKVDANFNLILLY